MGYYVNPFNFSGEIRSEKNFFNIVNEHKETRRNIQTFDGGLMLLEPDLKEYLVVGIIKLLIILTF